MYISCIFNPLGCKGNYSTTSNNTKLVHWPLMVGCYIRYIEKGPGRAIPNVTATVPITVLLYDGPLLCGFNAAIKGLNPRSQMRGLYTMALSFYMYVPLFVRLSPVFFLMQFGVGQAGAFRIVSNTPVTVDNFRVIVFSNCWLCACLCVK